MSIIISPEAIIGNAKIGYENVFTAPGVTVTASTEAATFSKENAYDGFTYDWWKPTATGVSWLRAALTSSQLVDYMAVFGHDLADQGSSVKPQYSTDNGASWIDAASAVLPSTNRTLFFSFASINSNNFRLLVDNPTSVSVIGGVLIGKSFDLPKSMQSGFSPPSLAPTIKLRTAQSETGAFIGGRKNSEGINGRFTLTNLDPNWIRNNWKPFIDHMQKPETFVFSWDVVGYSAEAVHAWVTGQVMSPSYSSPLYMDISLSFEGNL